MLMQNVVIIDYGSGNLHSAAKAFESAAREGETGAKIIVSPRPEDVLAADRVVLPGVGAYGDCKAGLERVPGLIAALEEVVRAKGRPFLGICVGMQLLSERGLEFVLGYRAAAVSVERAEQIGERARCRGRARSAAIRLRFEQSVHRPGRNRGASGRRGDAARRRLPR